MTKSNSPIEDRPSSEGFIRNPNGLAIESEIDRLRDELGAAKYALEFISNTYSCLVKEATEKGLAIDGNIAISLSNDANFLKDVASKALIKLNHQSAESSIWNEDIAPCHGHTHVQRGTEKDLIEFALAGLSVVPTLSIVIGCKSKDELTRYVTMFTDVRSDMRLRYSCDGSCRLATDSGIQSVELLLLGDSEKERLAERLAGYCRDYLWFLGMHDTFSLDAFAVMRASLIGEHNAIITFGYAADKVVDAEAIG